MVRLVWALAGLGIILTGASLFDAPTRYLDWRPALIVLGGMICFTFTRHSLDAVFRGTLHGEADAASIGAMRTMRSTTHASGAVGFLIGLIAALDSPGEGFTVGQAVASALLGPLYALIVGELFIAPVLHRRLAQYDPRAD